MNLKTLFLVVLLLMPIGAINGAYQSSSNKIVNISIDKNINLTDNMSNVYSAWYNLQGDFKHSGFLLVSSNVIPTGAVAILGHPANPIQTVSGDFDGDGYMEFVIIDALSNLILLVGYRGVERSLRFNGIPMGMVSARINNSWYLVLINYDSFQIVDFQRGYITSVYAKEIFVSSILSYDLDEDGNFEIVFCNKTGVYVLNETLKISQCVKMDISSSNAWSLAADFDGDNTLELFIVTFSVTFEIKNREIIMEYNVGSTCLPAAGDVDGDLKDEIILCSDKVRIIDQGSIISLSVSADAFSLANIDDSPEKEIIVKSENKLLSICALSNESIITLDDNVSTAPITVDFNGDGKAEIIYISSDRLTVMFGNGTIIYRYPRDFPVFFPYLSASDLNNDGLPEVLVYQGYWGEIKAICYSFISVDISSEEILNELSAFLSNVSVEYDIQKYHSYDEIIQILSQIVNQCSDIAKMFVIGKSYWFNGSFKDIKALMISNGNTSFKPNIMLIAAYHGRELITAESALYLAYILIKYHSHPLISQILDTFNVIIVPVVNIGGHDYALYFDWQRKNLHPIDEDGDGRIDEDTPVDLNGDGLIDLWYGYTGSNWVWLGFEGYDKDGDGLYGEDPYGGVDLNRNHMYSWSHEGSLGVPSSETYSGQSPLSEPETQAIDNLMNATRPIFAISLHSGEELVLFPWGTGYKTPIDAELYYDITLLASLASGFPAIQSCGLYEAPGAWDDDAYGLFGTLGFTMEIFRNASAIQWVYVGEMNGLEVYAYRGVRWLFNPRPKYIGDVCEKVAKAFLLVAYYMKARITMDKTPPNVEHAVIIDHGEMFNIDVYVKDPETGVNFVELQYKVGDNWYSRLLIYDKSKDCWYGTIPRSNEIYVIAKNRANLTTKVFLPAFKITTPSFYEFLNSRAILVEWLCGLNVTSFEIYVNNTKVAQVSGDVRQYTITVFSDGVYNLTILAYKDEEIVAKDYVIFYVDTTPPCLQIINPKNNSIISTTEVNVNWTALDNFGIDHFEIRLDESNWTYVGKNTSYTFKDISEGEHLIHLRAYDIVGNVNEVVIRIIIKVSKVNYTLIALSLVAIIVITIIIVIYRRKFGRSKR